MQLPHCSIWHIRLFLCSILTFNSKRLFYEKASFSLCSLYSGYDHNVERPQCHSCPQAHPCIDCHSTETPHIVEQWKKSRHSMNDIDCQICHLAGTGDPSAIDHNGFSITRNLTIEYCEECHALANEEMAASRDKNGNYSHAPLK